MTKEITEVKDKVSERLQYRERKRDRSGQALTSPCICWMPFISYLSFPVPTNLIKMFGTRNIYEYLRFLTLYLAKLKLHTVKTHSKYSWAFRLPLTFHTLTLKLMHALPLSSPADQYQKTWKQNSLMGTTQDPYNIYYRYRKISLDKF